jgi:hypothetical protein
MRRQIVAACGSKEAAASPVRSKLRRVEKKKNALKMNAVQIEAHLRQWGCMLRQ